MHKKFLDKVRILTMGLSMSLAFTQSVQASVFITPFGATQVYQTETQSYQTPDAVESTQAAEQGPGAAETPVTNVILPSAVYSTKEPISI